MCANFSKIMVFLGQNLSYSFFFVNLKPSIPSSMGVAVAIFSFRFHVLYFPVGYQLTVSNLTKHENQIVFHTVKH